jgi:hypothetical protein
MTHIHCIDRAALSPAMLRWRCRRLASYAFAATTLAFSATPVQAGCVSGDSPLFHGDLLDGPNCRAQGRADYATAVGRFAAASDTRATAVGDNAQALNDYATALGAFATGAIGATRIGHAATGTGKWSTAIGAGPSATVGSWTVGNYSIAIGGGEGGTSGNGAFCRP